MKNNMIVRFDEIPSKGKLFVHITPKKDTHITMQEVLEKIYENGFRVSGLFSGEIVQGSESTLVYNLVEKNEDIKMTDLITSYGASSLEAAPEEITDPKPKPKSPRRRRTRKTTTKTEK